MPQDVQRLVELDVAGAAEAQPAGRANACQRGLDRLGLDLVRAVPLQPEQHGAVGAVSETRERQ
jgi:hypothetical protein